MGLGWLKTIGKGVAKVFGVVEKVEQSAEPIVEMLLPASTPFFSAFDGLAKVIEAVEAGAATSTTPLTGEQKLAAALPAVNALLDEWVQLNLPGTPQILTADSYIQARTATSTALINQFVAFLNALPAPTGAAAANPISIATAGIVAQIQAAQAKTPTVGSGG